MTPKLTIILFIRLFSSATHQNSLRFFSRAGLVIDGDLNLTGQHFKRRDSRRGAWRGRHRGNKLPCCRCSSLHFCLSAHLHHTSPCDLLLPLQSSSSLPLSHSHTLIRLHPRETKQAEAVLDQITHGDMEVERAGRRI